jgi:hypothetical protein
MAARVGKIARLPVRIREELNQRLLDGQSAGKILPWLNALPEVVKALEEDFEGLRINDQNLSDWRTGGYQDWIKQNARIARTRELSQYAARQARADGGSIAEGAASIAAGHLLEMLEVVDEASGDVGHKLTPDALLKIASAVSIVRGDDQTDIKLALEKKKVKQKAEELALAREKYQRETCELFLKWHAEQNALDVANSDTSNADKIERLGQLMFGDTWKPAT